MSSPKVVVIGAGSHFFGRSVVWNTAHSEILRKGTLALVDTNQRVLETMVELAGRVVREVDSPLIVTGSTDRRELLRDADFVVLSFCDRNMHFRKIDTEVAKKHGITLCSADTVGPAGVFRALREIPVVLAIASEVNELAPNAWIINYVNPTATVGIALMRNTEARSIAICDSLREPMLRLNLLKGAGILGEQAARIPPEIEARLVMRIGGVNHFTWMTEFSYDGRDMLPIIHEKLVEKAARERSSLASFDSDLTINDKSKARLNENYRLELIDVFGAVPQCISHSKEYVPFFQGYGIAPVKPEALIPFDAEARVKQMEEQWAETEDYALGRKPIQEFLATGQSELATDIIESMWGNLGKSFFINTKNNGAVSNMADDAFLELRCHLDMHGPRPQFFGEMPRGILGMQQLILDTHELIATAAVQYDRGLLLRAMATDPLVNNIEDARHIIEEQFKRQKDALPGAWYKS